MAVEAFKKLEEELNCSKCHGLFTNPKELECYHVFCQGCLENQEDQKSITCPTCHCVSPMPTKGVAHLPSATPINSILEILKSVSPSAGQEEVDPSKKSGCCDTHSMELGYYCKRCHKAVCSDCLLLKGSDHYKHACKSLTILFKECDGAITSSMEEVNEQLTNLTDSLAHLDTRFDEIEDQKKAVETIIEEKIKQLHMILDARKTELIRHVHEVAQEKSDGITTQKKQIKTTHAQVNQLCQSLSESLSAGRKGEVYIKKAATENKETIVKQIKDIASALKNKQDSFQPNAEADIGFSESADIIPSCQNRGQVSAPSLPDPSQCTANGRGLHAAVVGKSSTFTFINKNKYKKSVYSLKYELVSDVEGTSVTGKVQISRCQYEVSYQPTTVGKHQLHVTVQGQHIQDSPFSVEVTQQ